MEGTKRSRGRPKLPEGEAALQVFRFRIKPEQRKRLEAAAAAQGITMTDFVSRAIDLAISIGANSNGNDSAEIVREIQAAGDTNSDNGE